MSAELRMLQEQTQQLALTLAQLGEALKAINARMDAADQAAQKRFADQELLIKRLGDDVERHPRADAGHRHAAAQAGRRSRGAALDAHVAAIAAVGASRATADRDERDRSECAGGAASRRPAPSAVDHRAVAVAHARDRQERLLRRVVRVGASAASRRCCERSRRSEAAAEAQFLLGETYSQQKRYSDAVNAYTAAIQNYPTIDVGCQRRTTSAARPRNRSGSPTPRGPRTNS